MEFIKTFILLAYFEMFVQKADRQRLPTEIDFLIYKNIYLQKPEHGKLPLKALNPIP